MSYNKTTKLGLNIWLENEAVNFEEVNENFTKIDAIPFCVESGTKSASFTGGASGDVVVWYYKKYSDGTIELNAKLDYNDLRCVNGEGAPYYSSESKVNFPFSLAKIYSVQMHLIDREHLGWVQDTTPKDILTYANYVVVGFLKEDADSVPTPSYKQVYITVKGVLQ